MAVLNPNDTSHSITVIPRFAYSPELTLSLYSEEDRESVDVANTSTQLDGFVTISFDYTFKENDKHQVKLTDSNGDVVYRGELFATSQNPQEYQQTKDLYYYE